MSAEKVKRLFSDGNSANKQKDFMLKKWPNWAKFILLLGIFWIILFFIDIPVQQTCGTETLLENQEWRLSRFGVFWNFSLQANDTLFIDLKVFDNLKAIFYIQDSEGERWLYCNTYGFIQNWKVPKTGYFYVIIENPYIQKMPSGVLSITRYMAQPEYRIGYPFRPVQFGLLIFGAVLTTIGLSAHPRFSRSKHSFEFIHLVLFLSVPDLLPHNVY